MTKVILVRHGQSEANLNMCFAGQCNPDLTELGYKQAERFSKWVIENYKIDKIYASDLLRAYNTAKPTADQLNLPIIKNINFREINGGKWENVKFEKLLTDYAEDYGLFVNDIGNSRCSEGESVKELSIRVLAELKKVCEDNPDKTILIATHATPIRAIQTILQKGDISYAKDVPWTPNASATVLKYEDGKFDFEIIGYTDYLDGIKSQLPSSIV